MSVNLQRLQALKRQATGIAAKAPARPSVPPRSNPITAGQLRALLRLRVPQGRSLSIACNRSLPGIEISPGLHLIESRLPSEPVPSVLCGAFCRRKELETARMLFFDTETTGLAGGVGTRAFMIGAAHWEKDTLVVRQLLTATLGAELAMLDVFRSWLAGDTILASYNGKSYDAPLLRARFRLARMGDPTLGLDHVDLLHPTRRRYRGVYENCRLATIERRVLGIMREDDLPGSEAPAAWLGYLRGGGSDLLRRVGQHNHQDVVTLATLACHLAALGDC